MWFICKLFSFTINLFTHKKETHLTLLNTPWCLLKHWMKSYNTGTFSVSSIPLCPHTRLAAEYSQFISLFWRDFANLHDLGRKLAGVVPLELFVKYVKKPRCGKRKPSFLKKNLPGFPYLSASAWRPLQREARPREQGVGQGGCWKWIVWFVPRVHLSSAGLLYFPILLQRCYFSWFLQP